MLAIKDSSWLSCHIYYQGSPDKMLTETVWPFVRELTNKQQVIGFFFIRYADERGPHIRLRLKSSSSSDKENLQRACMVAFPRMKFIRYTPELRRYGGRKGVAIAEQLFNASSVAILRHMAAVKSWTYAQALGSALQLHVGMASGFGMDRENLAGLFGHIASHYHKNDTAKIAYLEDNLQPQKAQLVPQLRALWHTCEQDINIREQWFSDWRHEVQMVKSKLCELQDIKLLRLPRQFAQRLNPLWYLYESYIHMTNNRLGLTLRDEPFIAYIIEQALKKS